MHAPLIETFKVLFGKNRYAMGIREFRDTQTSKDKSIHAFIHKMTT